MKKLSHTLILTLFCSSASFVTGASAVAQTENSANAASSTQSQAISESRNPATETSLIKDWFKQYDEIRRQAQLSPKDKEEANELLSKGLAIIIPGDDKTQTQKLLKDLVSRYGAAEERLKQLPLYPETEKLHRGYYQYFSNARQLFADYMVVQNNVLAQDQNGIPIAKTLMARKQNLEMLDKNNKAMDDFLRKQLSIPAYKYKEQKKK